MDCRDTDTPERLPARLSPWWFGLALAAVAVALAAYSLASGHMRFPLADIAAGLWSGLAGGPSALSDSDMMILWEVRLPRIAVAALVGAALGISGAVFQGLLLNPLADPYTLGVSSGSAFGAAVVIAAGLLLPDAEWLATPWMLTLGAFASACLTLAAVVALAGGGNRLSPVNLILAGVIVSAILSAALSLIKYLVGDQVGSIVFWLMGSFLARTWSDAAVVAVFLLPAFAVAMWSAVDLNIMTMGDRAARALGVDTRRVRLTLLAAASLAAAAAVSVAGIIGFVGLMIPHVVRLVTGPDHRSLIPLSALGGAVLLLAADLQVRVTLPGEIPVGVITALLAGPAFLGIFRRKIGGAYHD